MMGKQILETKRVSEAIQSGEQVQGGGSQAHTKLEAAAAFSRLLNELIGTGTFAGAGTDPLALLPPVLAELAEPVVAERPQDAPEDEKETIPEAEVKQSDTPEMQTEQQNQEQTVVAAPVIANVQEKPAAPVEEAVQDAPDREAPQQVVVPTRCPVEQYVCADEVPLPLNTPQSVAAGPVADQEAVLQEQAALPKLAPVNQQQLQAAAPKQIPAAAEAAAALPLEAPAAAPVAPAAAAKSQESAVASAAPVAGAAAEEAPAALPEIDLAAALSLPENESDLPPAANNTRAMAPKVSEGLSTAFRVQLQALEKMDNPQGEAQSNGLHLGSGRGAQASGGQHAPLGLKLGEERSAAAKAKETESKLSSGDQDKIVEKVKELLKNAEAAKTGNSFVVRLDPPSLGELMVKVTHRGGQVFARIVPESSEVETMLRSRVPELLQTLSATGINTQNVHVSIGGERSETEMFQFNQFFNESGSNQSSNHSGSGESEGRLSLDAEAMQLSGQMAEAERRTAQPGWVA